jgi:hypothetical protein
MKLINKNRLTTIERLISIHEQMLNVTLMIF